MMYSTAKLGGLWVCVVLGHVISFPYSPGMRWM